LRTDLEPSGVAAFSTDAPAPTMEPAAFA